MVTAPTPVRTDSLSAPFAALLPWVAGGVALALRLPFCVSTPQDPDGVRFVRALLRYDLVQGHPHPPGYPLFIALGSAVHRLGPSPAWSLSLISALALSALIIIFTRWCIPRVGPAAAAQAAALLMLVPLSTTLSARPLSDMLGAAIGWWALLSATRPAADARRTAALSALVLLVRASTFALCAPALILALGRDRRHRVVAAAVFALITVLGYLPVIIVTGLGCFLRLVFNHGTGHFQRFGGTVITQPDLVARSRAFLWTLWTHCIGGVWTDRPTHLLAAGAIVTATSLVGLTALLRGADTTVRTSRLVGGSTLFYAAWAYFGQNILWSPRHLLPILPALAWCFGVGVSALSRRWSRAAPAVVLVALVSLAHESFRLARMQRDAPPPTSSLALWLSHHADAAHTVIATAQLGPWIRALIPTARVIDIEDAHDLSRLRLTATDTLFVTSEVHGVSFVRGHVRARFVRDRYVNPALYDIAIIEVAPLVYGCR